MIATRRLDWQSFCQFQPARNRAILVCLVTVEPLNRVARKYRVSRLSIQANKDGLARDIEELMGEDILQETARPPLWQHTLAANCQKSARRKARKFKKSSTELQIV